MANLVTTSTYPTSPTDSLAARLESVKSQISSRATELGLAKPPTLIVVTKTHDANLVSELIKLGERNFGENRDQEAAPKARAIALSVPDAEVSWHFVGQLQSNKVKSVLSYSGWIHTLDRNSLLSELAKRTEGFNSRPVKVFIEVNLTERVDRGGLQPEDLHKFADQVVRVPGLELVGLMAVARPEIDPRVDFELVSKLRQKFLENFPQANLLSMGMSGDFLQAMEFGATHLRIGTAITGHRPAQN